MTRKATTSRATTHKATHKAIRKASRRATQRAGALSVLLAASLALLPSTAAHADGIRAQEWALDAMHTQQAWRTTKGQGITVAVLDTGVDDQHPDLAGNVLTGKDMVGFGAQRGDRAWARHGTAMAGIIAGHGHGVGNGDGVLGIAPKRRYSPSASSSKTATRPVRGPATPVATPSPRASAGPPTRAPTSSTSPSVTTPSPPIPSQPRTRPSVRPEEGRGRRRLGRQRR